MGAGGREGERPESECVCGWKIYFSYMKCGHCHIKQKLKSLDLELRLRAAERFWTI